jgi:hypothetical protein
VTEDEWTSDGIFLITRSPANDDEHHHTEQSIDHGSYDTSAQTHDRVDDSNDNVEAPHELAERYKAMARKEKQVVVPGTIYGGVSKDDMYFLEPNATDPEMWRIPVQVNPFDSA